MDPTIRNLFGLDSFCALCKRASQADVSSMEALAKFQRKLLEETPGLGDIKGFPRDHLKKIVGAGLIIECLELGGVFHREDTEPVISHSYLSLFAPRGWLDKLRGLADSEEDHIKFYFMDALVENDLRKQEKASGGALDMKLREAQIVAQDKGVFYYNYAMLHYPAEPLELLGEDAYAEATGDWIIVKMRYHQPLPRLQYLVACLEGILGNS